VYGDSTPAPRVRGSRLREVVMQVVYARQDHTVKGPALFLAGPTPRSRDVPSWRPDALRILCELAFAGTVFVPEEPGAGGLPPTYEEEQVYWEWRCLERAAAIVFWVPRDLKTLPGFTTNVEFGLYCRSGKALLGYPPGAAKMRYLELLARACDVPVFPDLTRLLTAAVARLDGSGRAGSPEERVP
jgi:Nucleoside 2-deoxyribosyltransferase like